MYYDTQGRIWLSRLTRWQLAEEGEPPELAIANTEFLAAMEYRYDAGRQRYMVRPRNPEGLAPYPSGYGGFALDNGTWHEYTGQSIYGDYAVAFDETTGEAEVTETFAHAPGAVQYDYAQPAGARRQNLRGNLVGTTERMVGESGVVTQRSVYTAFGELAYQAGVGQTRYGYCGAWGYEAATGVGGYVDPLAELGWLHVGERYYDPASGRFMQRDPIGIAGGWNVYQYCGNLSVFVIDPSGLQGYSQYQEIRNSGEGPIVAAVATGAVWLANLIGLENIVDAKEGKDRFGRVLTTGQRIKRGVAGGVQLGIAGCGVAGGLRMFKGPTPPLDPPDDFDYDPDPPGQPNIPFPRAQPQVPIPRKKAA